MIDPVVKGAWVPASPEAAFRRFTEEVDTWWPRSTHSVSNERCAAVRFEGREGGRVFEEDVDGATHLWGDVRVWDPPDRLVFGWHPGRGPDTAQEVEVTFAAEGDGTRVRVEHRGWERLGEEGPSQRDTYEGGWRLVLGLYADSLGEPSAPAVS